MKKILSVSLITKKIVASTIRFPISILLVAGLACLLFIEMNVSKKAVDIPYQLYIFFFIGAVISVSATLWLENFANLMKQHIITAVVVLLWGVYCFFLPASTSNYVDKNIEIVVIGAVAFLAMFFISFLKKNKDRAFWNFTEQTVFQIALAAMFGIVIFGGLSLAVLAIVQLFDITINDKIYGNLAISCFVLFSPLYYLANIPDKIAKHGDEIVLNKFLKIFAMYILIPLAAVYTVILYAYLFKIIIAWELPNGWVSWLVSVLAFGGLLIIMLLFPVSRQENNRAVDFIFRYFGLIILPLLILMSIGIFRRISDYGITIPRGYLLLLNIWFYGVYLYLFVTKSKHVKWIVISFATITLFVSIGFWSVADITKYTLTAEINKYLDYQKISLSDKTFFENIEQNKKKKIRDKIEYLNSTYGKEHIQPFFSDSIKIKSIHNFFAELGLNDIDDDNVKRKSFSYNNNLENEMWSIKKYDTFIVIKYNSYLKCDNEEIVYSCKDGQFIITIVPDNRVFIVPLNDMAIEHLENENHRQSEKGQIIEGGDYTVLLNRFSGYYYESADSISINNLRGYLFYNKLSQDFRF